MKWNDSRGSYKAYISLGSTCQTAYQLKRLGLRKYAGPLDWFVSDSVNGLIRLIENRFNGFMDFNNLQLIDCTDDCFVIRDNMYSILSFHDFPRSLERWWDVYPRFKETVSRRVNRFLKTVKNKPILLVRTQTKKNEAQELHASLKTLIHDRSRLLIVNHHLDDRKDVVYEDWGFDKVFSVTVPRGEDWRGLDQAWDKCTRGLKLQSHSIR
jgi:hypothetical protein